MCLIWQYVTSQQYPTDWHPLPEEAHCLLILGEDKQKLLKCPATCLFMQSVSLGSYFPGPGAMIIRGVQECQRLCAEFSIYSGMRSEEKAMARRSHLSICIEIRDKFRNTDLCHEGCLILCLLVASRCFDLSVDSPWWHRRRRS